MSWQIEYRHWKPGDDDGIIALLSNTGWINEKSYRNKFNNPEIRPEGIRLAICEGKIVGHALGLSDDIFVEGEIRRFGRIEYVFVAPKMRRHGIGKQLIKQLIEYFERLNHRGTILTTYRNTPAHAMYRKLGFNDLAIGAFTSVYPGDEKSEIKLTIPEPSEVKEMREICERWAMKSFPVIWRVTSNIPPVSKLLKRLYRVLRRNGRIVGYFRTPDCIRDPIAPDEEAEDVVRAIRGAISSPIRWATTPGSRYESVLRSLGCNFEYSEEVIMLKPIGKEIDLSDMEVTFWGIFW